MKSALICVFSALASIIASEAATLTFTNSGDGAYATGFGDASGNIASGLIWGIVVDTGSDGFSTALWDSGFTYTAGNTTGITLQSTLGGNTNDVLYINGTLTSSLSSDQDGAIAGTGRVNSIVSATYGAAAPAGPVVVGGKAFAIVWFDRGIALGSVSADGQKFGLATSGTNASPAFILPAADSDTSDFSSAFAGGDPAKSATFTLGAVPEPSTVLLGAIGVFGLLRRRRN